MVFPINHKRDSMSGKYFNYSDVLSYGWNVMKANLWFFVGLGFLFLIIDCIPDIIDIIAVCLHLLIITCIPSIIDIPYLPILVFVAFDLATDILGLVISIVLGIGLMKISLSFCDKQKPTIGTLFDVRDCFWRYVGAAILYGSIMLLGIIVPCALALNVMFGIVFGGVPCALVLRLLRATHFPWNLNLLPPIIISGIFVIVIVFAVRFGIQFGLCYYFVIDKGLGPVQAFKASSRTTMGVKWQLLGFGILCGLINLLGLLCLVVGVFAAYPTVLVASALVYRQLVAQTPELAEFGIVIPSPEPDAAPLQNDQEN
jgi:uncharacterized membrane protein